MGGISMGWADRDDGRLRAIEPGLRAWDYNGDVESAPYFHGTALRVEGGA